MKISIIIPTLNRPNELLNLVNRLNEVVKNEEVIIIDDSCISQENDLQKAVNFELTYINRGFPYGVSSARNIGAEKARGEYLLFFDDDDDFTENWLLDFNSKLDENADLIFCDMQVNHPNGKVYFELASEKKLGIVIPGAWLIRKEVFNKVGGYDERLKFSENTELLFRIYQLSIKILYLKKENFIYNQSLDGGSKNLKNMDESILLILEKHGANMKKLDVWNLNQTLGVVQLRLKKYHEARTSLFTAILNRPYKFLTYIRFIIACSPFISKRVYKANPFSK